MHTDSFSVLVSALVSVLVFSVSAPAGAAESIGEEVRQMDAEVDTLPPLSVKPPAGYGAFDPPPRLPDRNDWPISTPHEKPWYTNLWKTNPFAPRHRPAWTRAPVISVPVTINDWAASDNLSWYYRLIRRFRKKFPSAHETQRLRGMPSSGADSGSRPGAVPAP